MCILTRNVARQKLARAVADLPGEVWVLISGHMSPKHLPAFLQTCRYFAGLDKRCWEAVCCSRFPDWTAFIKRHLGVLRHIDYRQCFVLFTHRSRENQARLDIDALIKIQTTVTSRHRAILCEWLTEVTHEWALPSTIFFAAANVLDQFLLKSTVDDLDRFQLVGVACLRVATRDAGFLPSSKTPEARNAELQIYSDVTNKAFTAEEVDAMSETIVETVLEPLRKLPNPQIFLRVFWYTAVTAGLLTSEAMHVYFLAGFLLQLAVINLDSRAFVPSMLAAACLSTALELFDFEGWIPMLQAVSGYEPGDLQQAKLTISRTQATFKAPNLRSNWSRRAQLQTNPVFQAEWQTVSEFLKQPLGVTKPASASQKPTSAV